MLCRAQIFPALSALELTSFNKLVGAYPLGKDCLAEV